MVNSRGYSSSASTRDAVQNSIGLLVSILVRYPEVATCKLSPGDGRIKFTYILRGDLPEQDFLRFKAGLMESLEAFRQLERLSGASFQCDFSSDEKFSLLEISRDYTTLTRQEIALITSLVAAEFGERLVLDDFTDSPKEEQDMQDEIIENMLEDTKFDILSRDLIGFRENGRVFVYNKTS